MNHILTSLLQDLRAATSFENAAVVLLDVLQQLTEDHLTISDFKNTGKTLRSLVHLRPAGGYRGLVLLESGANQAAQFEKAILGPSLFSSATTWTLIEQRASAIAVDVRKGQLWLLRDRSMVDFSSLKQSLPHLAESQTLQHLLDRGTTHVLAIPMNGPGNSLHGMISIETNCLQAVGPEFVWSACYETLQLVADVATPILIALPLHTSAAIRNDPQLPVVGASMENLVNLLKVFADQDETILLTGATGVGKSRLAAWCHAHSKRRNKLFQTVDLMTVPQDMQMAELFGWKKGSFTGAIGSQQGCVARAEGGTLFIDEIDKLSLQAQAGLLQLLETRRYRVLGDPGELRKANVRFIIGTNTDLKTAVAEGRFREDLYFRINVLPVRVPSLNERLDEIADWGRFMAIRHHQETGYQGSAALNADAALTLSNYSWPGNLRQLDNVIRRAYAIALIDHNSDQGDLIISLPHIEQALGFETSGETPSLLSALRIAARTYAEEALRRAEYHAEHDDLLDLNYTSVFRGLVLQAVFERLNDLKQVYITFGQERLISSRNHTKHFRNELEKVEQFSRLLDKNVD